MTTEAAVHRLLTAAGLSPSLATRLRLTRSVSPKLPIQSSFSVGALAQASIAASALSAVHLNEVRGGKAQTVSVDERHAILDFHSESWTVTDGIPAGSIWDPLTGAYLTSDGHVRVHANFPHHRQGIVKLLQCEDSKEGVALALLKQRSELFEQAAANVGLCATALRSFEQWDVLPQGAALQRAPPLEIIKVGDSPRRFSRGPPTRPLEGVKVLDLTRVIAGPVSGRTLAAHGADVLLVTSPELPSLPTIDVDTSRGKRTAQLNLSNENDRSILVNLARDADVFLQSYRPGGLQEKGFGVEDLVKIKPGIIYASVRAYGWDGPWASRRGFDSLTQTATGFNVAEADAFNSFQGKNIQEHVDIKPLPMQCLDHAAGQILALGINAALARTYTEGGSYEVRVSLAAVGTFLRSLPRISPSEAFGPHAMQLPEKTSNEIQALSSTLNFSQPRDDTHLSSDGRKHLEALRHAAVLSETPVQIGEAPRGLNAHQPVWIV